MKKWWLAVALAVVVIGGLAVRNKMVGKQKAAGGQGKIVVLMNSGPKETDKVAVKRLQEDISRFNELFIPRSKFAGLIVRTRRIVSAPAWPGTLLKTSLLFGPQKATWQNAAMPWISRNSWQVGNIKRN